MGEVQYGWSSASGGSVSGPVVEEIEFAPETSIDDVIRAIVQVQFRISDVDCSQWIEKLRQNLIVDYGLLVRLHPKRLERLELPLLLEDELSRRIEQSQDLIGNGHLKKRVRKPKVAAAEKQQKALHASADKGALLGLSDEMRIAIKESWAIIIGRSQTSVATPGAASPLNQFFEEFYANFLEMDKVGRRLFEGTSMIAQAQALMKMMTFIITAIDNPVKLIIPLKKLGARHLIYGVERKNFQAFGIALSKTIEKVLGPEKCTSNMKEAWYILIQNMGDIMMEDFDDIRAGWPSHLFKRDGSKWRLYPATLTHEKLVLYKDELRTKIKEETYLHLVDSMDLEEDNSFDRPNSFCFSLTSSSTVKAFFCAENEEDLLKWSEELIQRIRAHQRVNQTAGSESESKDTSASSEDDVEDAVPAVDSKKGNAKQLASKKVAKLKSVLKEKEKIKKR